MKFDYPNLPEDEKHVVVNHAVSCLGYVLGPDPDKTLPHDTVGNIGIATNMVLRLCASLGLRPEGHAGLGAFGLAKAVMEDPQGRRNIEEVLVFLNPEEIGATTGKPILISPDRKVVIFEFAMNLLCSEYTRMDPKNKTASMSILAAIDSVVCLGQMCGIPIAKPYENLVNRISGFHKSGRPVDVGLLRYRGKAGKFDTGEA